VLRYGITGALFVPAMGGDVVKILVAGGGHAPLAKELGRLSMLGSDNAAALLTFLVTRSAFDGGPDAGYALERCQSAAARGHAYAQYVMSCVNRKLGNHKESFRCLRSAIDGKFLPAFIDYANFIASGAKVTQQHYTTALKIFWAAHKLGHRAALMLIARLWLKGKAGWWARLAGLPLVVFAILRGAHYMVRHPLSEKIFVLARLNEPLVRDSRT
jgi:hypothetical protein